VNQLTVSLVSDLDLIPAHILRS